MDCAYPNVHQARLNETPLRAVIFDMDGVLVDSHPVHRKAWRSFLQTMGREVLDSELDFVLDGRRREDILRHFMGSCSDRDLEAYGRIKDRFFQELQLTVVPIPGVIVLVKALFNHGVKLAVATSASASRAHSTLIQLGISPCFEAVVTGEDVSRGKPDPAVYFLARERLGIQSRCVLAIEDAVSGVRAAVGAGLRCVAIEMHEMPETLMAAGAACVVSDFRDMSVQDLERTLHHPQRLPLSDGQTLTKR